MRNENEFNAKLGKTLRSHEKEGFLVFKVAQKYHEGVSDFFIWHNGTCAVLETKFILALPAKSGRVLKHEFQGAQLNWLRRAKFAGGAPAFGLVAVHDLKTMYLFDYDHLPENGNWQGKADFVSAANKFAVVFSYGEERSMMERLFL